MNGNFLTEMRAKNEARKRLVSQLEFDVNMVEREGKRLEADLNKVKKSALFIKDYKGICNQLFINEKLENFCRQHLKHDLSWHLKNYVLG